MSRLVIPSYTVVRDIQEKQGHGWTFSESHPSKRPPRCKGTVVESLKTGDYTMRGYEDIFVIERKQDLSELWGNYKERRRFEAEMQRMQAFKHRFIVIETSLTSEAFALSPPQFTTAAPGKALVSWLMGLMIYYKVPVLFAGPCGLRVAQQLMESVIRIEKDRWVTA